MPYYCSTKLYAGWPRHGLYFGPPWADDGHTIKKRKGSSRGPQNMGKVGITRTAPLGATRGFHFRLCTSDQAHVIVNSPRHSPRGIRWRFRLTYDRPLTVVVDPEPPWSPQLMVEVLGTGQLLDNLIEALPARFWVIKEDGGLMLTDTRSGCGLHSL